MAGYDYTFKIMILGHASVPKASLTIRYITGYFAKDLKLTIGVDFYSKTVIFEDKVIKMQIWDFGGEERFRFLLSQYCKGANGAIFLYDIINKSTLEQLPDWLHIIKVNAGDIPVILAGTNLDLEPYREISYLEGLKVSRDFNLNGFIEVSPKTGENVNELFSMVLCSLLQSSTTAITHSVPILREDLELLRRYQRNKLTNLSRRCIYCGTWLDRPGKRYTLGKIQVSELRFCCACFNQFHGKSLDELPPSVIKTIEKHIEQLQSNKIQ